MLALALGHVVNDIQGGALPICLPQLKELFGLSYSQLAAIVLLQNVMSSVIQPVFGYLTDRYSLVRWLPFCAALSCAGFAFVGWAPSYIMVLCIVVVVSLGSATFHPQASKTVNFLSGLHNKASNMGIFMVGGNLGLAAGSIMMTFLLSLEGGLDNTIYFVLPGLLAFACMHKAMPDFKRVNIEHKKQVEATTTRSSSRIPYFALFLILFYIFMRSTINAGISTYIPIFFIKYKGFDQVMAGTLVSAFLIGGAVGTYTGALISDKYGVRKILIGSVTICIPAIASITWVNSYFLAIIVVFVSGFCIIGSFATTTIITQCLLPNNVGMASGLSIGMSVGFGGVGVTILGFIADSFTLPFVMQIMAFLPIICVITGILVPIPAILRK